MRNPRQVILDALRQHMGDDLARANRAFGGLPDSELDKEHGESGKTRRQIWDSYRLHVAEVKAAQVAISQLMKDQ